MRSPFFMYFSARSASWAPLLFQQITRCHSVFSCFSPPCPVHCRLVAKDRVATREPLLVLRTSGSAPKFPISMTLLRLRLTTDLQTLGGSGPRATTVYDPQVILSIKDTPLVLKFCRPPLCRNGSPQHHCVLDWPTVVTRPSRDLAEAERLIQTPGRRVRRPHLEVHRPHATAGECLEHALDQRASDPLPSVCHRDAQVQDFSLVGGAVRDDVARHNGPALGHEERYARCDALGEVVRRPGIGEHGSFDRGDVADVSQPGGANRAMAGRGAPPIWPALRQDVRTRAPRWPGLQWCGRCPPVPRGRGAGSPRGAGSRAGPERSRSNGRPARRSAPPHRPPRGGAAPARRAPTPPRSAPLARTASPRDRGETHTARHRPVRAAHRSTPPPARPRASARLPRLRP